SNCQGCHQAAKAGGGYVMTAYDHLLAGGESGLAAIVPKDPEESYLIEQVTSEDGKAAMPLDRPALAKTDVDLLRRWIAEGAVDDTPAAARQRYDQDHPPVYTRPPVITALDYSPDGQWLAVGGFHEVLLWKADGSERVGRLIGLSERIESVRFSPDGKRLAVTGGLPGRMGEVQVWDVSKRKLLLSVPVTFDTVYGASWSPDGTQIAFGCADNTVRAIDAKSGAQVLYMGSHTDWALDTAFSVDGSHLISVGRDMTTKLTEVATQRFVDNVTSITPGALKGGLAAVVRHPKRDEILVGGSDGVPKIYRIYRETARKIGDDDNLVAAFEPMPGRIFSASTSADGKRFALGSSLNGTGQVDVYAYEFDPATAPDAIKTILAKDGKSRSPEERAALNKYQKESAKRLASVPVSQGSIYAVALRPDGAALAAAGADGSIRLIAAQTGAIAQEFQPAPLGGTPAERPTPVANAISQPQGPAETETPPEGAGIVALEVQPTAIGLPHRFAYAQLVVTARTASGDQIDVTRLVEPTTTSEVVEVSRTGLVRPTADGQATLRLALGEHSVEVPVSVSGQRAAPRVDYVHDVMPVLSRLGCNAGTCHGSAQGKNGFKLSLRGYDPLFDVRALSDDHGARRVNLASPDDSLMLLKPTGSVPHVGGGLMQPGEPYYEVLRDWIARGATLDTSGPRVARIEVFPPGPVVQKIGARQQLRVL
ncbi:MAG TPA: c-type cytochrome domain-containing protein, partial [Isosphaeraceae bacterium]